MTLNIISSMDTKLYWSLLSALGVAILVWFIARDFKSRHKYMNILSKVQHEAVDSLQQEVADEAVLLLDPEHRIIGANALFYSYTGLEEMTPYRESIQYLAAMFPASSRSDNNKQLDKLLQQGSGTMSCMIQNRAGAMQEFTLNLFSIHDGKEIITYYLSMNSRARLLFVQPNDTMLQNTLLTAQQQQKETAVFLLRIEGIQKVIADLTLTEEQLLQHIEQEFNVINNGTLHYMSSLDGEQLVVVIGGDQVETQARQWAQSMIEMIHYIINVRSHEHIVVVNIGIALLVKYEASVDGIMKYAEQAMQEVKYSGKNGYHILST